MAGDGLFVGVVCIARKFDTGKPCQAGPPDIKTASRAIGKGRAVPFGSHGLVLDQSKQLS
jgi:hypothetical protein